MSILNYQAPIDARRVVTGKDGQLFVYDDSGNQIFLAEITDFKFTVNFKDTTYQPVGSAQEYSINTGFGVQLTMTETVIRDDVMLQKLLTAMAQGYVPTFDFQGKITRPYDGQTQRQICRNCLPTSNVDIMDVKPGELVTRPWTFAVNAVPELLDLFKTV